MSLLGLPLEIREKIYRELLCPPKGIRLQYMEPERIWRKQAELDAAKLYQREDNEDGDEDYYEKEGLFNPVAAVPVPTSILYVNRQISWEASPMLFKHNRFTFDSSAVQALAFLRNVYPYGQRPQGHQLYRQINTCRRYRRY